MTRSIAFRDPPRPTREPPSPLPSSLRHVFCQACADFVFSFKIKDLFIFSYSPVGLRPAPGAAHGCLGANIQPQPRALFYRRPQ